jgi:hypothetical protein
LSVNMPSGLSKTPLSKRLTAASLLNTPTTEVGEHERASEQDGETSCA